MFTVSTMGHVIGLIGMICVVLAFLLTVEGKWSSQGAKFNWTNLAGGVLLLISLFIHFNLGSFVIEIFWIAISFRGLYKCGALSEPDPSKLKI